MAELSRRQVIILGGIGAGVVVAGGATALLVTGRQPEQSAPVASPTPSPSADAFDAGTLTEPPTLTSADGRLELELAAAPTTVAIGGTAVQAITYNGTVPGPTLRLTRGDRVSLRFVNGLGAPTNLHTHGLVVSPEGNSDNVFVMIDPGGTHDYEYVLGADHPPGVFWYHPHHHGNSAEQLFGGLYGAIIVADETPIDVARERVLVVSDIGFDAAGNLDVASNMTRMQGREGGVVMVNGQVGGTMLARPGERERWRIVNACSSRYLRLRLDGQSLTLLGIDGGRYDEPRPVEEVVLTPGNRADLLVTMTEGAAMLRTLPFDRGSAGMGTPASNTTGADLATLTVAGDGGAEASPIPSRSAQRDLRLEAVTGQRTITLAMGGGGGSGGMQFTIDGKQFDHERIDTEVASGAIEEWQIVNTSTMDHPFHLHVWPMQLVEINGAAVTDVDYRDVVPVPANGRAIVRIAFEGVTGKAVYHCHILDHEDQGMMGVIRTA